MIYKTPDYTSFKATMIYRLCGLVSRLRGVSQKIEPGLCGKRRSQEQKQNLVPCKVTPFLHTKRVAGNDKRCLKIARANLAQLKELL